MGLSRLIKQIGPLSILAIVGLLSLSLLRVTFNAAKGEVPPGNASLVIQYLDGRTRMFIGPVVSGMTVLDAVNSASLGGNFGFNYSVGDSGAITYLSIDNLSNQAVSADGQINQPDEAVLATGREWHFYLNKNLVAASDIGKVKIKDRDVIKVKFE